MFLSSLLWLLQEMALILGGQERGREEGGRKEAEPLLCGGSSAWEQSRGMALA